MSLSLDLNTVYIIGGNHVADEKRSLQKDLTMKYPKYTFVTYESISNGSGWSKSLHTEIMEKSIGCIILSNKFEPDEEDVFDDEHERYWDDSLYEHNISFGKGVYNIITEIEDRELYPDSNAIVIGPCKEVCSTTSYFLLKDLVLNYRNKDDYKIEHVVYLASSNKITSFDDFIDTLSEYYIHPVENKTDTIDVLNNGNDNKISNLFNKIESDANSSNFNTKSDRKGITVLESIPRSKTLFVPLVTKQSKNTLRRAYGCGLL